MKRVDLVVAILFFLLGAWVLWQATMLPTFSVFGPGPEFMPNVAGGLMVGISAMLFANSWRNPPQLPADFVPDRTGLFRIAVMIVAIFLYTALLEAVGYLVLTFSYATLMLFALARYRWYVNLGLALAITVAFYYVFVTVLQVPVPKGIFSL